MKLRYFPSLIALTLCFTQGTAYISKFWDRDFLGLDSIESARRSQINSIPFFTDLGYRLGHEDYYNRELKTDLEFVRLLEED